ncbi:DUF4283 domain-containing protein [Salix suchowensis]|nr:DUF4283 domain-containing protein [Salix suchowensis]
MENGLMDNYHPMGSHALGQKEQLQASYSPPHSISFSLSPLVRKEPTNIQQHPPHCTAVNGGDLSASAQCGSSFGEFDGFQAHLNRVFSSLRGLQFSFSSLCMVGFFISYKMPYYAVNSIATRVWKSYGLEKVTVLDNGFIVFRFSSEESMGEVLARGPWLFGGKTILLQKWHPGFQFDKNKIKSLPVWARLHGLPFPLWNKQGLSLAASMVGKPLACDEATLKGSRMEYARVCIELDASSPPVHRFQVASSLTDEPITVEVVYEWKPSRCSKCNVFGHSCKIPEAKPNKEDKGKGTVLAEGPLPNKDTVALEESTLPNADTVAVEATPDNLREENDGLAFAKEGEGALVVVDDDKGNSGRESNNHEQTDHMKQVMKKDKGKLPQCVESRMDTISSSEGGHEATGSSSFDPSSKGSMGVSSNTGSSTTSPKAKKRKGKKRREASGLQ